MENVLYEHEDMKEEPQPKEGCCQVTNKMYNLLTALFLIVPLLVALFFPKIASILSYVGSVAGLVSLYLLPVCTYLKKLHIESQSPLLARADQLKLDYLSKKLFCEKS